MEYYTLQQNFFTYMKRKLRSLRQINGLAYLGAVMVTTIVTSVLFHVQILFPTPHAQDVVWLGAEAELMRVTYDKDFVVPNDLLKQTALGIKTYNRPQCLQEIITSVRMYAPYLQVFVVDDSDEDAHDGDLGDVYIRLPTDSGTGYGRNRLVEAIHKAGYKYLIMSDDDFKITSYETIPFMAKHMLETNADVLAATRCDHNLLNCQRSKGLILFDQDNQTMTVLPNITSYRPYPKYPTCYRTDLIQQFLMAKTETLLKVRWDDRLKNNDHYDFLLAAKQHHLELVTCSDVLILHKKTCEMMSSYGKDYTIQREQRWFQLLSYVMKKWSLKIIYDEVGKRLSIGPNNTGIATQPVTHKYSIRSNTTRFLIERLVEALNNGIAAWLWIRPVFNSKTWVIRKEINACTQLLSGHLEYELDRYVTFKNYVRGNKFSMYMYNESCQFAESLWRLRAYGVVKMNAHVYYITAVSDDTAYLRRLMHVLDTDAEKQHTTLIIVNMDLTSRKTVEANIKTIDMEVILVDPGPPFSRSIGLKVGYRYAMKLANSRGQDDAIGFSIDTSIITPADFSSRVRRNTICGVSAYVPVVYKCMSCLSNPQDQSDGYWVSTGFGMVGLCFSDYVKVGGWGTSWGYHWGGEDVDLMDRLSHHLPYIIRTREPNYLYIRDPVLKEKNPLYYMKKNLFPKALPPSYVTVISQNQQVNQRLFQFIQQQVRQLPAELQLSSVSRTYTDNSYGLNYQVLLKSTRSSDILWFFVHSYLSPLL